MQVLCYSLLANLISGDIAAFRSDLWEGPVKEDLSQQRQYELILLHRCWPSFCILAMTTVKF
jgi:hypothetical protein